MNKHYVAVYGTLKKGYHNHERMGLAKFVKYSHTGAGFALFVTELPYLVKRDDGNGCEIEIYEVDDMILEDLDKLEGHPVFYTRVSLREEDGLAIQIYVLSDEYSKRFKTKNIKSSKESYKGR